MKNRFCVCAALLLMSAYVNAADVGTIVHPAPKEPLYLKRATYAEVLTSFAKPPAPGSTEQLRDEKVLQNYAKTRTVEDCSRAQSEARVTLKGFFGPPNGALTEKEVAKLEPFIEQLRNDSDVFIQQLKIDLPRQRPFLYVKGIEACVAKEVTQSYPSGHATLARLDANVLSDLYPERAQQFQERALVIANDRVLSGMHHPSDIEAGRALADRLYADFKKSDRYQADFAKLKSAP